MAFIRNRCSVTPSYVCDAEERQLLAVSNAEHGFFTKAEREAALKRWNDERETQTLIAMGR